MNKFDKMATALRGKGKKNQKFSPDKILKKRKKINKQYKN